MGRSGFHRESYNATTELVACRSIASSRLRTRPVSPATSTFTSHAVRTIAIACAMARLFVSTKACRRIRPGSARPAHVDQGVLRAWIVSMGRRDAVERIAHLMLELYVRMRNVGLTTDDSCQMPLTQTVFADALGLTPIHTNRVLRTLRERGIMALGSGKLTILDIAKLARIAGFDDNYLHRRISNAA